jgi:AraC-like DNA-binding protein
MDHSTATHPASRPAEMPMLRFSTRQFSDRERLVAWREFVGRTFCRTEIEPLSSEGFTGLNVMRMLPGLGVISGNCSALRYLQTRQFSDSDDVIVTSGSGPWQLNHSGKSIAFAPGDAVLTSAAGLGSYTFFTGGPHWGLRVPFKLLSPYIAGIEDMFGRRIPAQTPALRLLRFHLGIIKELDSPDTHEMRAIAAAHVRDLIALAVGATREGAEIAGMNGARAARLRAIKTDIQTNLGNAELSVATLAVRHHLPVRSIQRLFEAEGSTFTEFLVNERLARAHRMLHDTAFADWPVSTIAFDCGFQHVSYFNRAFRLRFGAAPSDVREQPLRRH